MANNSTEKFTHIGTISVMSSVIGGLKLDGTVVIGFGYATHQPPAEKRAGRMTLEEAHALARLAHRSSGSPRSHANFY